MRPTVCRKSTRLHLLALLFLEIERYAIDAVTRISDPSLEEFPSHLPLVRRGAEPLALEHMAQVTVAIGAEDLNAR